MSFLLPLIYFIVGSCWASFWITVGEREANLLLNTSSRSLCPHCQLRLQVYQLIPILGWFLQHGKCAYCRHPISPFSTIFELLTAYLFVANDGQPLGASLSLLFTSACLLMMSATDNEKRWIDPILLLPLALLPSILNCSYVLPLWQRIIIAILLSIIGHYCHSIGDGDILFISYLVICCGVWETALIVLVASSAALIMCGIHRRTNNAPLPFVPWLAGSIMIISGLIN